METIKIKNVTFVHGDCMEWLEACGADQYDLAIVDPPYGIDINSSGRLGHYGGKGKKWDIKKPDSLYFKLLFSCSKDSIIWGGNYFELPPTRCFLIWDKIQPEGVSFASCEYAYTSFDKSAKTFYKRPQNADIKRIHPTQKPVKLYEWILLNYAKPGDTILDTHGGSGSIAIACHNLGYELTIIERDREYFDNMIIRFKDHISQLRLF